MRVEVELCVGVLENTVGEATRVCVEVIPAGAVRWDVDEAAITCVVVGLGVGLPVGVREAEAAGVWVEVAPIVGVLGSVGEASEVGMDVGAGVGVWRDVEDGFRIRVGVGVLLEAACAEAVGTLDPKANEHAPTRKINVIAACTKYRLRRYGVLAAHFIVAATLFSPPRIMAVDAWLSDRIERQMRRRKRRHWL
jgi:hypothetical protein